LSSSGRQIKEPSDEVVEALGPDTLSYPEATQNMKDMIHGIHASSIRDTDYEHVRDRNGGAYYNWSEVTFPNDIGNCLVCHDDNTYGLPLSDNVLMTTNRTTGVANGQDATTAAVVAARKTVPNGTDWVITPATAACYSCHDSADTVAHMEALGGAIDKNRSAVLSYVENCVACHGPGSILPVGEVHTALNE
jgi:OmcA/MtrC family decaheme c-type cytochrome